MIEDANETTEQFEVPQSMIVYYLRLLKRGLSFEPHAIIANGDHVYWDQRTRRSPIRRLGRGRGDRRPLRPNRPGPRKPQ